MSRPEAQDDAGRLIAAAWLSGVPARVTVTMLRERLGLDTPTERMVQFFEALEREADAVELWHA